MRNKVINLIWVFFILLAFHFVGITFLRFVIGDQISFFSSSSWSLWKDMFLFSIYGIILYSQYKKYWTDFRKYFVSHNHYKLSLAIFGFMTVAFLVSLINTNSPKQIFLWVKYDFLILLPLIFFPMLRLTRKEFRKIFDYFLYSVKISIVLSLLYSFIRDIKSSTLRHLGFSFSNTEFAPDARPPAVYETADAFRVKRESWSFAWPNSLGFYIAFILPILSYYIKSFKPVFRIIGIWTFIISLFLLFQTLSRTAMLVVALEMIAIIYFLYVWNNRKNLRYIFYVISFVFAIGLWGISRSWGDIQLASIFVRADSNQGHVMNTLEWINYFLKFPFGYWLWTAWPAAVQLNSWIIPENRWVQIFLETWIFGWLIYIFIFWLIIKILVQKIDYKNITHNIWSENFDFEKNLWIFLAISLAWIMTAWMLLHSFEDSMLNLTMFGLIGLYIGLKETGFQWEKVVLEEKKSIFSTQNIEEKKQPATISYSYHKPKKKKKSWQK